MGKEPRPAQSRPAQSRPGRPRPGVPAGVIAVVRAPTAGQARAIVRGLILAAVPAVELTMTVPGAVRIIAEFAASALSGGTVFGAGTVLDPEACSACAAAGAAFIVSPVTDPAVLARAHDRGVPYVGGALTPTEVLASMRAGSDAVKLFPVGSVGGAGYLRALREPLPGLRAVVSGGIAAAEVPGYLAAGAHAVCLGGALIDRAAARRGDVDAVAAHTGGYSTRSRRRTAMLMITELLTRRQDRCGGWSSRPASTTLSPCSTAASSCGGGRNPGRRTGRRRSRPRRGASGPGTARRWPGCRRPTGNTGSSSR